MGGKASHTHSPPPSPLTTFPPRNAQRGMYVRARTPHEHDHSPDDVSVERLVRDHAKALHARGVVLGRVGGLALTRLEHRRRKVPAAQQHDQPRAARGPQPPQLLQQRRPAGRRRLRRRLDVVLPQHAAPHRKGLPVCGRVGWGGAGWGRGGGEDGWGGGGGGGGCPGGGVGGGSPWRDLWHSNCQKGQACPPCDACGATLTATSVAAAHQQGGPCTTDLGYVCACGASDALGYMPQAQAGACHLQDHVVQPATN